MTDRPNLGRINGYIECFGRTLAETAGVPLKNKQITIIDVAKEAGVSIATVSNVLNRRNVPLAEETIRKVEEAAARLGYRRNVMAASLSRRKTFELGLIMPGFGGYYGDFAHVMQSLVHKHGYHLSVYSSSGNPELEQRHLETLLQRRVDGLFCHGLAMTPALTRTIVGEGTPMVLFNAWGWPGDAALGAVNLDFAGGAAEVVRHLAERGCRTLFYLGKGRARAVDEQRRIGFQRGVEAWTSGGADVAASILEAGRLEEGDWIGSVTRALETGPAGVLAFDDFDAFVAISMLRERGIDVPGQVKVAGINDQPMARLFSPSITSIAFDLEEQVRGAVGLLLGHLEGEAPLAEPGNRPQQETVNEISIPTRLVPRKSTE